MGNRGNRIVLFAVTLGLTFATGLRADDNVREVQEKLRDGGFYSGEVDGAYSSDLSAALSRYQIRNGLPITGQLDVETSKALGAKPAVGPSTAGTEQSSSETWRRLRKGERRTSTSARRSETVDTEVRDTSSRSSDEAAETSTETRLRSAPPATAAISSENAKETSSSPEDEGPATGRETRPRSAGTATEATEPASAPPATTSTDEFTTERLRDYVAAYVLAGLDRNVGAETEFFADRVQYYDQGIMNRERIREDLKRYDERWPERHFWVAGKITVEPQSDNRVRVTFPLGFKLRNANKQSSGKVTKTLVLERAGEDLQVVAVNEGKTE
jgi:peptidoglycan hydrolase-like protein with peptidoglycan-binding domain